MLHGWMIEGDGGGEYSALLWNGFVVLVLLEEPAVVSLARDEENKRNKQESVLAFVLVP